MINFISWKNFFLKKKLFELINFINTERRTKVIYPPKNKVFRAFIDTPFHKIKVVIIGQDPYHQYNQANGLSFSVNKGIKIPPTLKNIYIELNSNFSDLRIEHHGCLSKWAFQGVLLLNNILTVEHGKPKSHYGIGWEVFTDQVIYLINKFHTGVVFLLWGKEAQRKKYIINTSKNYILEAPHPSPLSAHRGFFGCRHFLKVNRLLEIQGKNTINWSNE